MKKKTLQVEKRAMSALSTLRKIHLTRNFKLQIMLSKSANIKQTQDFECIFTLAHTDILCLQFQFSLKLKIRFTMSETCSHFFQ